ncbi:hypothetical protein BCT73_06550 [Vibrio breoganii]|uniref:alpha-1,2-fucosyltransferase n=1 Tax=Vibrio breoganii TaxID=553239 RepID=UPI000C850EB1|nr:alpha-1,2-fucosyltransferase [Vibrio breoganii]PML61245.1 hypothetical protein BCT73_06550 [Vibrio breoganii]
MIIVNISGGLGNQMFQYALGKSLSIVNEVPLKLDISFFENQSLREFELDKFSTVFEIATSEEIRKLKGSDSFFTRAMLKLGFEHIIRPNSFYREKEPTIFDESLFLKSIDSIYLLGYWQNEDYFKSIRDNILSDFTYRSTDLTARYAQIESYTESVSLHVRRGDYVTVANATHGLCDISYYLRAIKHFELKYQKCHFFVFSDDILWCKEAFKAHDNITFVDDTRSSHDDLYLMSKCKHQIIANSSFSWWGAWLNQNKGKHIVAPKKWINNNPNDYNWVPTNWTKM